MDEDKDAQEEKAEPEEPEEDADVQGAGVAAGPRRAAKAEAKEAAAA